MRVPFRSVRTAVALAFAFTAPPVVAEEGTASAPAAEPARAQDPAATASLEARIAALEAKAAAPLPKAEEKGAKPPEVVVKLGGVLHTDGRIFFDDDAGALTDDLLLRRARLDVNAKLGRFSARLSPDLGMGKATIHDAFVDARLPADLKLRVGKFIPPIGLERLQSSPAYYFLETALSSNLAPTRDVGVQLGGEHGKVVLWAVGLFAGAPDAGSVDGDVSDRKDVAARVFVKPLSPLGIEWLSNLGVGVSGSLGAAGGDPKKTTELGAYKSEGLATIFDYLKGTTPDATNTAWGAGRRARLGLQASWFAGPAAIVGEYLVSQQRVRIGAAAARLTHRGWQAVAFCNVTGERATDGIVAPTRPLDAGGWGALQVAARVSSLDLDDDAFPLYADPRKSVSRATSVGAGVSWWPTSVTRLIVDYVQTFFDGGGASSGAVADRSSERALLARAQVAF